MKIGRTIVYTAALCAVLAVTLLSSCAGNAQKDKADEFFAQGKYDNAVELYNQALAKDPHNKKLAGQLALAEQRAAAHHRYLGQVALGETRLLDARSEYRNALKYEPDSTDTRASLDSLNKLIDSINEEIASAKALAADKKWTEAMGKLTPLRKYSRDFPDVGPLYAGVVDGAYANAMKEGNDAYNSGDFPRALEAFQRAASLKPDERQAEAMLAATRNQVAADQICEQAAALLRAGDWRAAVNKYGAALNVAPDNPKAVAGMKAAKGAGAKTLMSEADTLTAQGNLPAAIMKLDEAFALLPDYAGVAEARAKAKRAMADKMFADGGRYENAGHLASALVCYRMVKLLVPDYHNIEEKLAAGNKNIEDSAEYEAAVVFKEPDNLEEDVIAKLVDEFAKGGIRVLDPAELDAARKINPGYAPDGVLTVTIEQPDIVRSTPKTERRTVRYVKSTRQVENVEHAQLQDEVERDRDRVLELEREIDDQQHEVHRIERERDMVEEQWHATSPGDPNREALRRRLDRLRDDASRAEDRLNELMKLHDAWVYRVRDEQARLRETPPFIEEVIYADYTYDIVTNRITATQDAVYTLMDKRLNMKLVSGKMTAEQSADGEVVKGFKPAGIAPKPDELPSKGEMEDRVAGELADRLPKDLADALRKFPLRYLYMAEVAEKAGDKEAAFDNYARYAFVCRVAGLKVMPRLAESSALVMERTGYSPLNDTYDLARLLEKAPGAP